ncbi:DUF397 domain-containing protein [Streptomyces bluensis]|uniref:DUF397 domain-containing protein n=1 Tax=Streptomyces bluensis TaxID=33897 RepID=UPI00332C3FD4
MTRFAWQKSSYSGQGDGTNCVEIGWQKSSYSGSGDNNCVEIAAHEATFALRESDAPTVILHTHGPQLAALLHHITATTDSCEE